MSSCQSFLRQRVTGSTVLVPPATTAGNYFTFVSGPGNYVGNYPPGWMVEAGANVAGLLNAYGATVNNTVLRDMGKTIKASVATNAAGAAPLGTPGFFREVQLLVPSVSATPLTATNNGVIGQLPGSLPAGGNSGDGGYATFYIPIVVSGVVAGTAASPSLPLTIAPAGIKVGEQL
jgi:hypothetical protein